ncbi:hypothetical protein CQW23_32781 [Capsicum baccatum]|uniref:Uncharacterized protein n=1 Tax=Capsicum baccatum TaxID=33114 RepID=A0A2G2V3P7_CAPBA|nr:hypothetical protein CQW23_32781 [Capsicum baccatum]
MKDSFYYGISEQVLDNKTKGFLLDEIDIDDSDNLNVNDDIDRDLDTELELLTRMNGLAVDMKPKIDRFYITILSTSTSQSMVDNFFADIRIPRYLKGSLPLSYPVTSHISSITRKEGRTGKQQAETTIK